MKRIAGLSLPVLLLCCLLGVFVGAGGYTVWYGEGMSYLSNDPRACVNWHIMREHYDGWQMASHHAHATCNDCHVPPGGLGKYLHKAENGFWHSKGFTLQDYHEPILIRPRNAMVLQQNCIRCHAEMVSEITAHHTTLADALGCIHCHGSVGHGPRR
ncbi:MAG: cytochrome c nitrite reductase small subunit [Pirellulales bacterium]|nr:cytochrome c nitrite reductase small subunit [Pirellulales bacterium]